MYLGEDVAQVEIFTRQRLNMHESAGSSELRSAKHVSRGMQSTINVNEEYRKALRTKSYVDVWTKIHRHLRRSSTTPPRPPPDQQVPSSGAQGEDPATACTTPLTPTPTGSSPPLSASSSPFSRYSRLPGYLLDPRDQEALLPTVRDPELHALFLDYFDASLEACNICVSLLASIDQLRRDHRSTERLLNRTNNSATAYAQLTSYVELENPLSSLKTVRFNRIHGLYDSLTQRLMLARNTIRRRAWLLRLAKWAAGVTLVAACGALATAMLLVGAHAAVVLLAAAGGLALVAPIAAWIERSVGAVRSRRRLAQLGAQVDAAARGAYIMGRSMETVGRMVARVHDELEHRKEVVRLFLRSGERWVLTEAEVGDGVGVGGGGGGEGGFLGQLDELEEHVYWCLLTINRTRGLVAHEMAPAASPTPSPTTLV